MSLDATSTDSEKFKSQHEVYSNPKFDIDPSFLVVPGWMLFGSLPEKFESPMWLVKKWQYKLRRKTYLYRYALLKAHTCVNNYFTRVCLGRYALLKARTCKNC